MQPLNLLEIKLSDIHLIEAGAGTGKTYTITGLFLRLILEHKMPVDRILVVTFTNAATEELKERIRHVLIESKRALLTGKSREAFISSLLSRVADPDEAMTRLEDALRDFDSAAIYTIHGFCQRLLYEHAFEIGDLFDAELIDDQNSFILAVAEDFWRRRFYEAPAELIAYARSRQVAPSYFHALIQKASQPLIRIIPKIEAPTLLHLSPFRSALAEIKALWPADREEVKAILKDPALSGVVYGSLKPDDQRPQYTRRDLKVSQMLEEMDRFSHPSCIGIPLVRSFENYSADKIVRATRKGSPSISHRFFDLCERLLRSFRQLEGELDSYLLHLRWDCAAFAERELPLRKAKRNVKFFDDLLSLVYRAVVTDRSGDLAAGIRQKYGAALVDEFQDTDMLQFEIFSRIFIRGHAPLFMIGDPKQSIYSFRGADVFSYMQAARSAANKHTLLTNYRSDPGLIRAVNAIFSAVPKPFVFDEISFEKGKASRPQIDGATTGAAPLKLWWLAAEDDHKPIAAEEAVQRIARAVAFEISRLVTGGDGGQYAPGDIAVLVRTNRQANVVKSHLNARCIPSVLYSAGNVFDSQEALELERVLKGIAAPRDASLFRAALATSIMGVAADRLDPDGIEYEWHEAVLENFLEYRHAWNTIGFIRMISHFLSREKVRPRLLSLTEGDRRLTNLLHLCEVLHTIAMEKRLGISALLKWFSVQRDPSSPRLEAHQLRLESDADAVKIITIHKSKGLEYPVVFCPYAWGGSRIRSSELSFHDTAAENRLTLDLGSSEFEANRILAQNELLAENLRLLYVALTRAQKRAYLAWGRIHTAETSALAYLLHTGLQMEAIGDFQDRVGLIGERFQKLNDETAWSDLKKLESRSQGAIEVTPMPDGASQTLEWQASKEILQRRPKEFSGAIDRTWRIVSYSSLVSGRSPYDEAPDRDETAATPNGAISVDGSDAKGGFGKDLNVAADRALFAFPKGAAAGIFFHDILEHLDFSARDEALQGELVNTKLHEHGFSSSWQDAIMEMIRHLRQVPLLAGTDGFSLSSISRDRCIHEMEFYFPLQKVTPEIIRSVFSVAPERGLLADFPEQLERLTFAPARGFMKGFIDMVFEYRQKYYIIDWKSNFLGASVADYRKDLLAKEMTRSFYTLQYHLYTLAVHLFLTMRKPDYDYARDFGGIFYLFIRGLNAAAGSQFGIFADRPSPDMINALAESLIPEYRM